MLISDNERDMQKLLRWELPPDFLRRERNASRLKSFGFCFVSGFALSVFTFAAMLSFVKPRHPVPLYFVFIAAFIFILTTTLVYWLMAFMSPMVVFYDKAIWLKYGHSRYSGEITIKIAFPEIAACRLSLATGKNTKYTLLQLKLKDENKFSKWELERIREIGIPLSIDDEEIAQVLQNAGIIVINEM